MSKLKKTLLLTASFLVVSATSAYAGSNYSEITAYLNNDIKLTVNGSSWTPKDADGTTLHPLIYNGSSYLPLKSVAEALGASVNWDSDTTTITIQTYGTTTSESGTSYVPFKDSEDYGSTTSTTTTSTTKPVGKPPENSAFRGFNIIQETAALLGVEVSEIQDELKAGKTLAKIANEKASLSEETYLQELTDAIKVSINASVTAGDLTQEQADAVLAELSNQLKRIIENTGKSGQNSRGRMPSFPNR